MITFLVLIFTLSLDTFVAALSYEASNIKIPIISNIIISFICSFVLALSLIFGNVIGEYINDNILKFVSFLILFSIGIFKIFDEKLKMYIRNISFKKRSLSKIKMIIKIYSDYEKADADNSKRLSAVEAISLALALSLDGFSAGIAFNTTYFLIFNVFVLSLVINMLIILFSKFVSHFTYNINIDFSRISGMVFIILGILKIF